MRTHTTLTPSQIEANTAFAAAHPAVRAAVKMSDDDAVAHLRAAGLNAHKTLGWTTHRNVMSDVRKLEQIKDRARAKRDEVPWHKRVDRHDDLEPPRKAKYRFEDMRFSVLRAAAPSNVSNGNVHLASYL